MTPAAPRAAGAAGVCVSRRVISSGGAAWTGGVQPWVWVAPGSGCSGFPGILGRGALWSFREAHSEGQGWSLPGALGQRLSHLGSWDSGGEMEEL